MQLTHVRRIKGVLVLGHAATVLVVSKQILLSPALPRIKFRSADRMAMELAKSQSESTLKMRQPRQRIVRSPSKGMQTLLLSPEITDPFSLMSSGKTIMKKSSQLLHGCSENGQSLFSLHLAATRLSLCDLYMFCKLKRYLPFIYKRLTLCCMDQMCCFRLTTPAQEQHLDLFCWEFEVISFRTDIAVNLLQTCS